MRAIDLALKDLVQLVRDWKSAVFLLAMPIVFTLLFGFAFGGFGGQEDDPRLPVGFQDLDTSGTMGLALLDLLRDSDVIRPEEAGNRSEQWVEQQIEDKKLAGALVVPEGYGTALLAGQESRVILLIDTGSTEGLTVRSEVQAVTARLAGSVQAANLSAQEYSRRAGFASQADRQAFVDQALQVALTRWQQPAFTLSIRQSGDPVEGEESSAMPENAFAHTSPSMMVQFAIAGLMGAATILVQERKSRALRRLLTTAISRLEIIAGHYLAMLILIFAQLLILVLFGQFILKVDYPRQPVAILLVMLATALWTAALGLLIGTLAKNDDQVVFFTLIPMFVLAGMGGAWIPLEITGQGFQTVGHLLPSAWAMDGFENVVIRRMDLASVLVPVGVMLAYAVLLGVLAAWRFRFE